MATKMKQINAVVFLSRGFDPLIVSDVVKNAIPNELECVYSSEAYIPFGKMCFSFLFRTDEAITPYQTVLNCMDVLGKTHTILSVKLE